MNISQSNTKESDTPVTLQTRWKQLTKRKGAILVMIAAMLVVLLAMVAFAVDVSYMQLVRTELRAANDSATKAGTLALSSAGGNANVAKAAAIEAAARNQVAGKPYAISAGDIQVGRSVKQGDGKWVFEEGAQPFTAMRINGRLADDSAAGAVKLFFAPLLGEKYFETAQSTTASQLKQEIVLCIDRSHSMCFDLTGINWKYPAGTPPTPNPIVRNPHPTDSRWAKLMGAVNQFNQILQSSGTNPKIALVTWGSNIGTNTLVYLLTGQTAAAVVTDLNFTTTYSQIDAKLALRSNNVMLGGTNMSSGIDASVALINGGNGLDPLATKTIVLMTDGQWNQGRDPVLAAQDAAAAGITIHAVTFLQAANQTTAAQVAATTGGRHIHATNAAELTQAFTDLANTLNIVYTE